MASYLGLDIATVVGVKSENLLLRHAHVLLHRIQRR